MREEQWERALINAFRSTLEEAREADLLLHVLDYSDESCRMQREVTEETLEELGAGRHVGGRTDDKSGYI